MQQLAQLFKEHKLKVTPQRLAIYHMLLHTQKHPSAEKIHRALETTHPSMSLATVYKTLDTLKQVGLIQELNVGEESFRYDANTNNHAHIRCRVCNEVFDMHSLNIEHVLAESRQQEDFHIEHMQLFLYGVCNTCK